MNTPAATGLLSLDDLAQKVTSGRVDTVAVGFTDCYGRLMGKRFDAGFFLEHVASHGTHACNYLLTVDMEMEPVPGYAFASWELGYGDVHLVPDMATLRIASWLDRTALVLCDVHDPRTGAPAAMAPRTIMACQAALAAQQGYAAMAGTELEYYLYRESYHDAAKKGFTGLEAAGWYLEDYHMLQGARVDDFNAAARRHLNASGVPVECSKGEWGLGQHELNVRYTDVMGMADRHCIFKQCFKELADRMGVAVTFMAKVSENAAGSSCHVHLSLLDQQGRNVFAGDEKFGPVRGSRVFRHFLAGWIIHVPDVMPFYAPTVNSYKRYRSGSWAPTTLAWSHDNRTAGFRVVGEGRSLRIECRIPGADCNPYLTLAAALASGLDGVARELEPPPCFEGDAYAAKSLPRVPSTLREAAELFAASGFARDAFGQVVVEHYTHFFRTEADAADRSVTDWERRRYFERV
jgi:glutamine synthetase